jgi:hypothetical protein|tara:strand:+ start:19494 stop:19910 length:417 start_codon:yes stop_codon:yes gene_type:complete
MAQVTLTLKKGELLDLLKGLWAVSHIQGKEFSLVVTDNILKLKELLDEFLLVEAPEAYRALTDQAQAIINEKGEDTQDRLKALELANPEVMAERDAQLAVMEEQLQDEGTIELKTIAEGILPEEITPAKLMHIRKIVA